MFEGPSHIDTTFAIGSINQDLVYQNPGLGRFSSPLSSASSSPHSEWMLNMAPAAYSPHPPNAPSRKSMSDPDRTVYTAN